MNKQVGGFMYKNKEQSLETFTMSAENPEFHKRLEVLEETINLILASKIIPVRPIPPQVE